MQILKQVVDKNHTLNAGPGLKPDAGKLNEALKQVSHLARHDCLVCLITDGNGINPETRRYITRLAEHNDVLTAFIFDPLEKDMPAAGRLRFADGDGQLEADTSNRKLRTAFQNKFEQRLEQMQSASRRFAMPLLPLDTCSPVSEQIRDVLGHHQGTKRF
jgi:GGDEF domain-containing protein